MTDEIWNASFDKMQEICKLFNETKCKTLADIHTFYVN